MTEIVNRLRERAKVAREEMTGTALGDALHFEEAANEIERLCARLAKANDPTRDDTSSDLDKGDDA